MARINWCARSCEFRFGTAISVLALCVAVSGDVRAGGIFLYEVGTPDMFTAGAGWAARAQDAGTVLTNPAGMARLRGGNLLLGAGVLYGDITFTPGPDTNVFGNEGGVAVGWLPTGGGYYAHGLSDHLSFGLGVTSNFRTTSSYDDGWLGRYYVKESKLRSVSILPSLAFRLNPHLSMGASLNVMRGTLEHDVAIKNLRPTEKDGQVSLSTMDTGLGVHGGVLWEATDAARIGVTYTSPLELDFADVPDFTGLGPGMQAALDSTGLLDATVGIDITVPQTVMASFWVDLNASWSLMGDVGMQDWSEFGGVEVAVPSDSVTSLTTPLLYKDTWRAALGVRRQQQHWSFAAGIGYDSSMVEEADRSVVLPAGEAWRFAAGAQHALSSTMDLGFGYSLVRMGNLPVDQERGPLSGRVQGAYKAAVIHVVAFTGAWRF